jgi:hypothetical protein
MVSMTSFLVAVSLCACKVPASEDLASRAPLDDRVDAFLEKHALEPLDCGVVEYSDRCSEDSAAAIQCFATAQANCTEARLDTVSWFAGPASPFYATYILWAPDTECVMDLLTYSVDDASDGEEAFSHSTCTSWDWLVYKDSMCKKQMWEEGDCR